jgi:hypothetical protein
MIGGRGTGPHRSRVGGYGVPVEVPNGRFLYSLASTLALTALMVAVPIVLWSTAGWPFGDWGLPAGRHLAVSGGFDPRSISHWLGHSALLLAWIAWLWMALCVLTEITTLITGRPRARLPGSRTMQSIAACLVGTALTVAALSRTPAGTGPTRRPVATQPMRSIPVISDLDHYWQTAATGAESNGSLVQASIRIGPMTEGTLPTPGVRETSEPARAASHCGTIPFEGREETPPLAVVPTDVADAVHR